MLWKWSKAVNVSESHIGDNLDCVVVFLGNPRIWKLYVYHLVDHMKPCPDVPHLKVCVIQVVRYERTVDQVFPY